MPNKQKHSKTRASTGATILALLACYGTLALVSILSLLGITVTINNGLWAVTISAFYGLAVAVITFGARRNRIYGPMILGLIGFTVILWVMFGAYNWIIELLAFTILIAAAVWDRSASKLISDNNTQCGTD